MAENNQGNNQENNQGTNQENNQGNNQGNKKRGRTILIVLLIFFAIGLSLYLIVRCSLRASMGNDGSGSSSSNIPQLITRSAKNSDISIDVVEDISLSNNYMLIANVDIKGLELKFTYLDKNKKIITTVEKTVGNVVKGGQYTVSVSLSEFSFLEFLKISYSQCEVIGGTVSYFA